MTPLTVILSDGVRLRSFIEIKVLVYRDRNIISIDTISFAYRQTATSKRKWHFITYDLQSVSTFTPFFKPFHCRSDEHGAVLLAPAASVTSTCSLEALSRRTECAQPAGALRRGAARSSRECARMTLAVSAACALPLCRRSSHPLILSFVLFSRASFPSSRASLAIPLRTRHSNVPRIRSRISVVCFSRHSYAVSGVSEV